jgi:hypothetical protein
MSAKESLVTVCTAKYMEAQIIKGRLESEDIPVLLRYESAGLIYGLTIDGLGEVQVMVPEHLAEEARGILREGAEGSDKYAGHKDES